MPTYNRGNSLHQFAFVNGRPVQDKLILSAIRGAYAETIPHGRYPVAVLSIAIDPALVDVNVHPAKADVRFRDPGLVRGLIVGAIREALAREGDRAATTGASGLMRAFRPENGMGGAPAGGSRFGGGAGFGAVRPASPWTAAMSPSRPLSAGEESIRGDAVAAGPHGDFPRPCRAVLRIFAAPSARGGLGSEAPVGQASAPEVERRTVPARRGAGAAPRELYRRPDRDGIVIVDQHAAMSGWSSRRCARGWPSAPFPPRRC